MIRSGSICISFLYNYLMSNNEVDDSLDENGKKFIKKTTKLKCLSDTFQSYGGVLAKLSQIVCFDNENNSVFSDCKPYSREKTIKYLKKEYEMSPELHENILSLDFEPFKSGSVGQVHKGVYKDGKDIILKVQYVGLKEQMETDLYILDKLVTYLYTFANLTHAMGDIKAKLNEELDYTLEYCNQQHIYDLWKDNENIKIADLIPDISNEKMLGMYYIDANSLPDFIEKSTQEERNNIGKLIIEFIFTNLYKEGIFYSDIHYGNFLIKNNNILYVMDFGCIHDIEKDLLDSLLKIHRAILIDDSEEFYKIVENLGIIDTSISSESKEYIYNYFKIQYEPWLTEDEFEFTDEWLETAVHKEVDLMKEWFLPQNMVYLNKMVYGLPHILTKLKLKGNFMSILKPLLNVD
jgi:predicted unusual protein kinase regulating ubiquinone biosynthesis (AarF/ABC1/UbiB family)